MNNKIQNVCNMIKSQLNIKKDFLEDFNKSNFPHKYCLLKLCDRFYDISNLETSSTIKLTLYCSLAEGVMRLKQSGGSKKLFSKFFNDYLSTETKSNIIGKIHFYKKGLKEEFSSENIIQFAEFIYEHYRCMFVHECWENNFPEENNNREINLGLITKSFANKNSSFSGKAVQIELTFSEFENVVKEGLRNFCLKEICQENIEDGAK